MVDWVKVVGKIASHIGLVAFFLTIASPFAIAQPGAFQSWPWLTNDVRDVNYLEGFLTANDATLGIAWDAETPTDSEYATSASSGAEEQTESWIGWTFHETPVAPVSDEFIPILEFTSAPTTQRFYLNASRTLQLDLYIKDTVASPCNNDIPVLDLEVHAWVGNRFLGGTPAGPVARAIPGDGQTSDGQGNVPAGWCVFRGRIHAETDVIEMGETVRIQVLAHPRSLTYGQQLILGLADPARSILRIPYYSVQDMLVRRPEYAGPVQILGAALPALGVAAVIFLSRRYPAKGTSILLAVLVSGCSTPGAGGGSEEDLGRLTNDSDEGSYIERIVHDDGTQYSEGKGGVVGLIQDPYRRPVAGAFMSLLASDFYDETDSLGRFVLNNVTPGSYTFRVDHQDFLSFEASVRIEADASTRLDITLAFRDPKAGEDLPHAHSKWPTNGHDVLFEQPVTWAQEPCDADVACYVDFYFPIDEEKLVWPGAAKLTVTFTWDELLPTTVKELGFAFMDNTEKRSSYGLGNFTYLAPRPNGVPFTPTVGWEMTDVGHQSFTTWRFRIYAPTGNDGLGMFAVSEIPDDTSTLPSEVQVRIEANRGVVPLEPGHPDFWRGNDSRPVRVQPRAGQVDVWDVLDLVPPGTAWLDIYLNRSRNPPGDEPYLAYIAADSPTDPERAILRQIPTSGAGVVEHIQLRVPAGQSDPFYAQKSGWEFHAPLEMFDSASVLLASAGRPTDIDPLRQADRLVNGPIQYSLVVTAHRTIPPAEAVEAV